MSGFVHAGGIVSPDLLAEPIVDVTSGVQAKIHGPSESAKAYGATAAQYAGRGREGLGAVDNQRGWQNGSFALP